jgi:hypothetical protein
MTMKLNSKDRHSEPQLPSSERAHGLTEAAGFHLCPTDPRSDAIRLDGCSPFERIAVRTLNTDYTVVVLRGSAGDVLVRGGHFFAEFRRARLSGSTFGGSAIRLGMIEVGSRLELLVNGKPIVTSTIQSVSRVQDDVNGPCVM